MNEQQLVRRVLGKVDMTFARQELARAFDAWYTGWGEDLRTRPAVYDKSVREAAGTMAPQDYAYLLKAWEHTQECLAAGHITRGDEFSQMMKDTAPTTNEWSKPLLLPFMDEECEKRFHELMIAAGVLTADGEVDESAKGEVEALLGFQLDVS